MLFSVFLIATLFFYKGNDCCLLVVGTLFFEGPGNLLQKFIGDWCEGLIFIPNNIVLWTKWVVLHEEASPHGTCFLPGQQQENSVNF